MKDPVARLRVCLAAGDFHACAAALEALYNRAGATTSGTLWLTPQPVDKPISSYSPSTNGIKMTRFLRVGEGTAYWRSWSKVLTGGTWDPTRVGDEKNLRALGNFALLGILAHELGHYLMERYATQPRNRHVAELGADRLAMALLVELRRYPDMAKLVDQYRSVVAGALLDAVPAASRVAAPSGDLQVWARGIKLPYKPRPYVALQLSRQRYLLDSAPALSLATEVTTLKRKHMDAVNKRSYVKESVRVTSHAAISPLLGAMRLVGITGKGRVCGLQRAVGRYSEVVDLYCANGKRVVPLGRWRTTRLTRPTAVAFRSDSHFYYLSISPRDKKVGVVEVRRVSGRLSERLLGSVALPASGYPYVRLALSPSGKIYVLFGLPNKPWEVRLVDAKTGAITNQPALTIRRRTRGADTDGPISTAAVDAMTFAVDDAETFYALDRSKSIRRIGDGVVHTVAGTMLRGYRDGAGRAASLYGPRSLSVGANGNLYFIDAWRTRFGLKLAHRLRTVAISRR